MGSASSHSETFFSFCITSMKGRYFTPQHMQLPINNWEGIRIGKPTDLAEGKLGIQNGIWCCIVLVTYCLAK